MNSWHRSICGDNDRTVMTLSSSFSSSLGVAGLSAVCSTCVHPRPALRPRDWPNAQDVIVIIITIVEMA